MSEILKNSEAGFPDPELETTVAPVEKQPQKEQDPFYEIQAKFKVLSRTAITREIIQEKIIGAYSREDVLDALDDSENARMNPGALYLILDMLDPKAASKAWVAEMLVNDDTADAGIKSEAQKYLDSRKKI